MMIHTRVNSQKAQFTTVSIMFSLLNEENNRNVFSSISISCIPAVKLCYKMKAVFRDLETPKLLYSTEGLYVTIFLILI